MVSKIVAMCVAGVSVGIFVIGCSPEAKTDYHAAGQALSTAGKDTGKAIESDVHADKQPSSKSGDSSSKGSSNALTNDMTSAKVKSALMAAEDMPTDNIHVDTTGQAVTLRGSVKTADQQHRAIAITKDTLGSSFSVTNQLAVGK